VSGVKKNEQARKRKIRYIAQNRYKHLYDGIKLVAVHVVPCVSREEEPPYAWRTKVEKRFIA